MPAPAGVCARGEVVGDYIQLAVGPAGAERRGIEASGGERLSARLPDDRRDDHRPHELDDQPRSTSSVTVTAIRTSTAGDSELTYRAAKNEASMRSTSPAAPSAHSTAGQTISSNRVRLLFPAPFGPTTNVKALAQVQLELVEGQDLCPGDGSYPHNVPCHHP